LDALNHGDYELAIRLFTHALLIGNLAGNDKELALVKLGEAYMGQGHPDKALPVFESALKIDPADDEAISMRERASRTIQSSAVNSRSTRQVERTPSAPANGGPKSLGRFVEWTAAVHQEAGKTVCYAFTRPKNTVPALSARGPVVLTVTERITGRDAIAVEMGLDVPKVTVTINGVPIDFYTAGRNAFARDGEAAVSFLENGSQAIVQFVSFDHRLVTDTYSLEGFSAAYATIRANCPYR
jgi:tetratricopeptide (TPR) repeat protein